MLESLAVLANGNAPDRGPGIFAVTLGTLTLCTVFVAARLLCRYFIVQHITWDDRVMMLAWLVALFLSFTIMLGANHGLGRFDEHILEKDHGVLRRAEYAFSVLYNPALALIKTSVLIFYLRLAKNTQLVLRYSSYFLLVIVNVASIVLTFMNIFQCDPISAAWNPFYAGKVKCIPLLTEFICASPINVLTDLALLALPLATLSKMQLPWRQKAILIFTFSLGIFVTVIDVIRINELQKALTEVHNKGSTFGGQANFARSASLSFMWSAIEVNISICCACIPTLKPLVLRLLPAMLHGSEMSIPKTGTDIGPSLQRQSSKITLPCPPPPLASPTQTSQQREYQENGILPLEFLTTPDMRVNSAATRALANTSVSTAAHRPSHAVYFGFVNATKPKSMLRTTSSESLKYCSIVSILFLLWGLSYGLLNTLNNVVASVNNYSAAQTLGLTSAYFGGGYLFGPLLVGEWILRRDEHNRSARHQRNEEENVGGFKVTFICGLCFYGTGTITFWPSAATASYGGFILSNFLVGFGLSILEVAANAFIILCGPPQYSETRLLFCQAIQAVGSVLSGLCANKIFFTNIRSNSTTLINVQWTYLAITLLCATLALFFFYMPLPEVTDNELEESAKSLPVDTHKNSCGLQLRTWSLILAVLSQYMYTAGQESNSIYFRDLLIAILPTHADGGKIATGGTTDSSNPNKLPGFTISIPDYLLLGQTAFAISRFLFGFLAYLSMTYSRLPKPRTLLTICVVLSFLFSLLPVVLRSSNPNISVIPVIFFFFAEGPIWPLIFSIGLRGQGRRTKRAAAFITMGGSGGGVVPFIMYGIISSGGTVRLSYVLIASLQVLAMSYPLFLECSKDARKMVQPTRATLSGEETPVDEMVSRRLLKQNATEKSMFGNFSWGRRENLNLRRKSSAWPEVQHSEDKSVFQPRT